MKRLFRLMKESMRDTERDYTVMGLRRAIVLLSVPMILEMGMEALFAIVDVYFVSRLGVEATSTVGITESMLVIVYSLAWGLGMGATALVARRTGEKDRAGARVAAAQSVTIAVLIGLALAIPGRLGVGLRHRLLRYLLALLHGTRAASCGCNSRDPHGFPAGSPHRFGRLAALFGAAGCIHRARSCADPHRKSREFAGLCRSLRTRARLSCITVARPWHEILKVGVDNL